MQSKTVLTGNKEGILVDTMVNTFVNCVAVFSEISCNCNTESISFSMKPLHNLPASKLLLIIIVKEIL